MTAVTATLASPKERLENLLDYWVQGAHPPDSCAACARVLTDRCDTCTQLHRDFAVLDAALGEVQDAPDYRTALAVYLRTCMHLTGIFPGSAAVLAPAEAGGAR